MTHPSLLDFVPIRGSWTTSSSSAQTMWSLIRDPLDGVDSNDKTRLYKAAHEIPVVQLGAADIEEVLDRLATVVTIAASVTALELIDEFLDLVVLQVRHLVPKVAGVANKDIISGLAAVINRREHWFVPFSRNLEPGLGSKCECVQLVLNVSLMFLAMASISSLVAERWCWSQ
uniref:Uncharacterized protein n=1 Tax=Siphovirus contig89 TaxID=1518022 RepID=A0A075EHQ8_9CAUD|nr:hypothetical protein [Siphovirus contig89]AIE38415.1 hypothetical protein [Siphovirus contig89]AIE38458.1 hypothetical protein [Siphovirus contig89]AIE38501.1 hypothetical protein [Siphovirus contig89]AIE38544.1 hypothetical protein [Siphovirus contig89]